MAKNEPPARLTDRKRAAIVEAAASEFRSRGFDNTSMDGIAEAAQVSKRTVYNHFPSKEALFAAIVDELRSRCDAVAEFPFDADAPLEQQLTEIGRSAIGMFASEDFQNLARVILPRFLQSPDLARAMMGEPDTGIRNWMAAAHQAGRLNVPNPKWAAKQFLGMLNSVSFWPQTIGGDPPLPKRDQYEIVDTAVDMFLSRYAV